MTIRELMQPSPQQFDKILLARLFLLLLTVMVIFAFSEVGDPYRGWVIRAAEGVLIALVAILRGGGRAGPPPNSLPPSDK